MMGTGFGAKAALRIASLAACLLVTPSAHAGNLDNLINMVIKGNETLAKSQARIDKLSDSASELTGQYRAVLEQIETMKIYNGQVKKLVDAQQAEINDLQDQIGRATGIGREITPLMLRMIDSLERFVELDVPFLLEERKKRVAGLRTMMDRADVADSEKYRRLLEAYQVENDYGRTIEAYTGMLKSESGEREVNYLRIGRISLMYMSLDEQVWGSWNQKKRQWDKLGPEYRSSIKKGLRMARKQTAPDLIRIPIPAPQVAKGGAQ